MRRLVGISGLQAGEDVNGSQQQKKKPEAGRRALARVGRSTRFHHMIAPVTTMAAGASPKRAQMAFVV
jgi:hypothetical protein